MAKSRPRWSDSYPSIPWGSCWSSWIWLECVAGWPRTAAPSSDNSQVLQTLALLHGCVHHQSPTQQCHVKSVKTRRGQICHDASIQLSCSSGTHGGGWGSLLPCICCALSSLKTDARKCEYRARVREAFAIYSFLKKHPNTKWDGMEISERIDYKSTALRCY